MGSSHPVDVHVGTRLRMRRKMLGMNQGELGAKVGITFQQVQKYERGINRIGSSRLHDFSRILDVPIGFFFDDFSGSTLAGYPEDSTETSSSSAVQESLGNKETMALVKAYYRIPCPKLRAKVLDLVKSLRTLEPEERREES